MHTSSQCALVLANTFKTLCRQYEIRTHNVDWLPVSVLETDASHQLRQLPTKYSKMNH